MTPWQILGIEPTVDKKKIKKAYAIRLKSCNPEDDPQQFQTLRKGYEQALEESKFITVEEAQAHSPAEEYDKSTVIDKTNSKDDVKDNIHYLPVDPNHPAQVSPISAPKQEAERILNVICDIYNDFSKRIRVQSWKQVLEQESLFNFEVKHYLRFGLIPFLIDYPHLPADVWRLLNDEFQWDEHFEELEDKFGTHVVDTLFHWIHTSVYGLSFNDITVPDQWTNTDRLENYLWNRNYLKELLVDISSGQPVPADAFKEYFEPDTFNEQLTNCTSDESRLLVEQLAKLPVKDPELLRLSAQHEAYAGNLQNAMEFLEKLAVYDSFYVEANMGSANILAKMGKHSQAQKHWFNVLSQERSNDASTNAIATRALAQYYFKMGNPQGAKDMYELSLRSTPYDIEARMRIVQINRSLLDSALQQIQDGNVSDETLIRAAECYCDLGELEKCVLFLADYEEETNRIAELLFIYARALDELNKHESAMKNQMQFVEARKFYLLALHKSGEQGKNGFEIFFKLGAMNKAYEDYNAACYYLRKALEFDPLNDAILAELADVYRKLDLKDNNALALETINKAISQNNTRWSYYKTRAVIYYDNEMWGQALTDFEQALKGKPDNLGMLHDKGYCHLQLGQYEQAIKDFATAYDYSPSYLDPLVGLARAYHGADNPEECRKYLDLHLEKAPESEYGKYWLEQLFPKSRSELEHLYGPAGADIMESVPGTSITTEGDRIVIIDFKCNPNVTDDTFRLIANLVDLEELVAHHASISDAGLAHLKTLPKLQRLYLGETAISEVGIEHLLQLPLFGLDLSGTCISDENLERLAEIKSLRKLWIIDCSISHEGIQRFYTQAPKCKVFLYDGYH